MSIDATGYSTDIKIEIDPGIVEGLPGLDCPSVFFKSSEDRGALRQFLTWDLIQELRDKCDVALAQHKLRVDAEKEAPPIHDREACECCQKPLVGDTEIRMGTCAVCLAEMKGESNGDVDRDDSARPLV